MKDLPLTLVFVFYEFVTANERSPFAVIAIVCIFLAMDDCVPFQIALFWNSLEKTRQLNDFGLSSFLGTKWTDLICRVALARCENTLLQVAHLMVFPVFSFVLTYRCAQSGYVHFRWCFERPLAVVKHFPQPTFLHINSLITTSRTTLPF